MANSPEVLSVRHGPVLVVRFRDRPNSKSLEEVRALSAELTQGTEPLSFVGIVPGKLTVPGAKLRAQIAELRAELRPFTSSIHFAIEGDGFFAGLQRNMYAALASAVSSQVRMLVHVTAEQAIGAVAAERQLDAAALLDKARAAGVLKPV